MPDSKQTRAQWQWRVIWQQLSKHGRYHPPKFTDPVTQNLITTEFPWSDFYDMTKIDRMHCQKRFIQAYQEGAANG